MYVKRKRFVPQFLLIEILWNEPLFVFMVIVCYRIVCSHGNSTQWLLVILSPINTGTGFATYTTKLLKEDPFTWDNVNAYFVLTDRFYNGDETNDHSYFRKNGLSGDENDLKTIDSTKIAWAEEGLSRFGKAKRTAALRNYIASKTRATLSLKLDRRTHGFPSSARKLRPRPGPRSRCIGSGFLTSAL